MLSELADMKQTLKESLTQDKVKDLIRNSEDTSSSMPVVENAEDLTFEALTIPMIEQMQEKHNESDAISRKRIDNLRVAEFLSKDIGIADLFVTPEILKGEPE